jgi:S1-C subfamily serine protease
MIDTRGYFLTASHCLEYKYVFLMFRDSSKMLGLPARVVWQGSRKAGQPDLAILHVERALKDTFEWADEIHIDQPAMAVGIAWTNKPYRIPQGFELMAGRILETNKLEMVQGDFSVANDLPLQPGDSGGPLVNDEGRLIGINVEGTPPQVHWVFPKRMFPAMAQHPNQNWLRGVIEADAEQYPLNVAGGAGG